MDDVYEDSCLVFPISYPEREKKGTMLKADEVRLGAMHKSSSIATLVTTKTGRRTTEQAHENQQLEEELWQICSSLFKVGSTMLDFVLKGALTLKSLGTPAQVASAVNEMAGIEFFSGNELKHAVDEGRAGKSPPHRGNLNRVVSDKDFGVLCTAVYLYSAIQQINGCICST